MTSDESTPKPAVLLASVLVRRAGDPEGSGVPLEQFLQENPQIVTLEFPIAPADIATPGHSYDG